MNGPPEKQELLAREKRLIRPVGIITLIGVAVFVASVIITSSAGDTPDAGDQSQLLDQYHAHSGTLMLGDVLGGIAFLLFSAPLFLLFNGARARADRVRRALVAFAFIGPVLLAIQGPIQSVALKQASDDFYDQLPALQAEQAKAEQLAAGSEQDKAGGSGAGEQKQGSSGASDAATGGEVTTTPTEQGASSGDSSSGDGNEDDAVEQGAEDAIKDNGTASFAQALLFPAVLGLVFGMVYISLWAMRTGLVTRFMGSLGMALGVALVLLPFAQLLIVLWFATLGLMLIGRWPGGLPPAWEAGVAIPWLRPGEAPPEQDGALEGRGREITPGESPEDEDEDATGPDGNGDGPAPRKRKRRR